MTLSLTINGTLKWLSSLPIFFVVVVVVAGSSSVPTSEALIRAAGPGMPNFGHTQGPFRIAAQPPEVHRK